MLGSSGSYGGGAFITHIYFLLHRQVFTHLCINLPLISTDKGFKGFESVKHHFGVNNASLTGHVYRGFHGVAFPISAAARVMARRVAA
jgi:hypothetical protein